MYTIKAGKALFQFSIRQYHDKDTIKIAVGKCLGLPSDKIEFIVVNNELQDHIDENALVYVDIDYRSEGFITVVDLGIIKYKEAHIAVGGLLLCMNEFFNDDVVTILNDDSLLLARNHSLFKAESEIRVENEEQMLFLKEDSITTYVSN